MKISSKKYLLIFDFDQTIVDQDSEYEQVKMTLSEAEYNKMVEMDYYDGFNYYFKRLITFFLLNIFEYY